MKDREKVVCDDVFVDVKAAERQLVEWIKQPRVVMAGRGNVEIANDTAYIRAV